MLFACLFILALIIGLPIFVCLGIPPLVELLLAGELPGTDVFFVPSASPLRPLADAADSRF